MDEFLSKIRAQDPVLYKKLRLIASTFEDISSTAPDLSTQFLEVLYTKYGLLSSLSNAVERLSLEEPAASGTNNGWDLLSLRSNNASGVESVTDMNSQHAGFVYDAQTGLYYDYKLQCHYIPSWRLYYFHQNMTYYTYDEGSHTLKFYCHAAMSSAENGAYSTPYSAPHYEGEKLTKERSLMRNDSGLPPSCGNEISRNPEDSFCIGGKNPSAENGACSTSYSAPHYEGEKLMKERTVMRNDSGLPLGFGSGSRLRNPEDSICIGGRNPSAENGACSTSYSAPHYEGEKLMKERTVIRNDSGLPLGFGSGSRLRNPEDSIRIEGKKPSDESVDSTCHKTLKEQHMDEIRAMKAKYGLLNPSDTKPPNKYVDRAENRRKQKKSSQPSEKTEMASPETPIDKGNKGFALLSKMGWVEGSPLGIRNDGITEPVMIKKRESKLGLGCENQITSSPETSKEAKKTSKKKQIAEITKKRFDAIE